MACSALYRRKEKANLPPFVPISLKIHFHNRIKEAKERSRRTSRIPSAVSLIPPPASRNVTLTRLASVTSPKSVRAVITEARNQVEVMTLFHTDAAISFRHQSRSPEMLA